MHRWLFAILSLTFSLTTTVNAVNGNGNGKGNSHPPGPGSSGSDVPWLGTGDIRFIHEYEATQEEMASPEFWGVYFNDVYLICLERAWTVVLRNDPPLDVRQRVWARLEAYCHGFAGGHTITIQHPDGKRAIVKPVIAQVPQPPRKIEHLRRRVRLNWPNYGGGYGSSSGPAGPEDGGPNNDDDDEGRRQGGSGAGGPGNNPHFSIEMFKNPRGAMNDARRNLQQIPLFMAQVMEGMNAQLGQLQQRLQQFNQQGGGGGGGMAQVVGPRVVAVGRSIGRQIPAGFKALKVPGPMIR